jgi:hypothetical protein
MVRTIYLNWRLKRRLALDKTRRKLLARWRKLNALAVRRKDTAALPYLCRWYRYITRNYPAWKPGDNQ